MALLITGSSDHTGSQLPVSLLQL